MDSHQSVVICGNLRPIKMFLNKDEKDIVFYFTPRTIRVVFWVDGAVERG